MSLTYKEPWQMTSDEFANPEPLPTPAPGNVIVYHRVRNPEKLDDILERGLLTSEKPRGFEGPSNVLWGADSPSGYATHGLVLGFELPKDRVDKVAGNYYMIFGDVAPEEIVYIDKPTYSPLSSLDRIRDERESDYVKQYHKAYVEQALDEDKPVPVEVVSEYF